MGWNNHQVLMEFPLLRVLDFRIGSLVSNSARNITGPFPTHFLDCETESGI